MSNETQRNSDEKSPLDLYNEAVDIINEYSIKGISIPQQVRSIIKGTPLEAIKAGCRLTLEQVTDMFNRYITKLDYEELTRRLIRINNSAIKLSDNIKSQAISKSTLSTYMVSVCLQGLVFVFMDLIKSFLEATLATRKLQIELEL